MHWFGVIIAGFSISLNYSAVVQCIMGLVLLPLQRLRSFLYLKSSSFLVL